MNDGAARGAIFDLDGTLADTAPDLVGALNDLMGALDLPPVDPAAARNTAGMGGRMLIHYGLEAAGRPADADAVEALLPRYLALYEARLDEDASRGETRLFDGAAETLDRLAQAGWRLGVCTNKPHAMALKVLAGLGLADRFDAVIGAGALPVRKPDPEHLLETIRRAGAALERSVLIGDTVTDRDAARAAGAPIVLVDFGYATVPIASLAPDAAIASLRDLPDVLERLAPAA